MDRTSSLSSKYRALFWQFPTLKNSEFFGYSAGGIASALAITVVASNLMYFLTSVWKLDPAVVGTIFLVTRLLDAIASPLMGIVSDRTNTQLGKYRPYLIFASPLLGLSIALLFSAPEISPTLKVITAYATYIFFGLMFTVVNIPFHGLTPLMTTHLNERTMLVSAKQMFSVIGGTIGRSAPILLVAQFDDPVEGWRLTGIIFGCLVTIFFLICASSASKQDQQSLNTRIKGSSSHLPLKQQLLAIRENKPFIILLIANSTKIFSLNMRGIISLYFYTYYVRDMEMFADLNIISLPVILTVLFLIPNLIRRFSKKGLYIYSSFLAMTSGFIAYFLVPYLNNDDIFWLIFLMGPIEVLSISLQWILLPDCSDYGKYKTGVNCSALLVSVNELCSKICSAFAGLLVGICLTWANYQPNIEQNESVLELLLFITFVPISISHLFSAIIMIKYDIK